MRFLKKYPVPLNELLLSPVVLHDALPTLADLPAPAGVVMREVAEFGGYSAGAIRTAMSRLRASNEVETFVDSADIRRYRQSEFSRGVSLAVQQRVERPNGFLLAIFAFSAEDARERQIVRDALRYHGFQKLAQNVYINGRIDRRPLEKVFEEQGLSDNVYLFECAETGDASLRRRLLKLFDVTGRSKVLTHWLNDLSAFLEDPSLGDEEFARRFLYVGPVHYRLTYVEEPPLPASYLPEDYPLPQLVDFLPRLAEKRTKALRHFLARTQ